jgi:phenylalanyl-tRNA synthetase beta chain
MKISINWLKQYVQTDLPVEKILEVLTDIGLEVEGDELVESIPGGLEGLVVGHVLTCDRHPNANKLSLTTVDIGEAEPVQIVCGAPNVAQGQKVAVATVGAMLYPSGGEPFKIKKGKIRGEVSEGMICAEDEIGLGNSHAGIMVLPADAPVGTPLAKYINSIGGYNGKTVEVDTVVEIGLTPNRSDATGHLGVAFDLAAALQINHNGPTSFKKPDVSAFSLGDNSLPIEVEVLDQQRCPRYSGICIKNVKIKESSDWLKTRLQAIGLEPKNNVVDITNFVLHELGQPLHAFDYDKINGQKIIVRTLNQGTKFKTLDEVERELQAEDLMICDGNSEGMCIAGVFGGIDSGVKDATVNIFLESAHFNAKTIRRTSMHHLLRTDAATRFEKGTDPNVTLYALKRAALLILQEAGGEIASDIIDLYPQPVERPKVELSYKNIRRLIGAELPKDEILKILQVLDMTILREDEEGLTVAVPTNKADVLREVDVIEEILRIYGFNRIETSASLYYELSTPPKLDAMKARNRAADWLAANGFNEMMNLSLSKADYYEKLYPMQQRDLVFINNTSNQQLNLMRPTMLFSGLETILHNQNRQITDLALFEFGKTYKTLEEGHEEQQHLSIFMAGERYAESWLNPQKAKVSFYTLKAYVENFLAKLGVDIHARNCQSNVIEQERPWAYALDISVRMGKKPTPLVTMGLVHPEIPYEMGIKNQVFYADINWDGVLEVMKKQNIKYQPIAKYPSMRRDLALVVDKKVGFEEILSIAQKQGKKLLKDINLFDVYENAEHLGEGKKSYAVSFIFQNEEKTLKDKEVDKIMNQLMATYEQKLSALIRK